VVEHQLCKSETLSSNPSPTKIRRRSGRRRRRRRGRRRRIISIEIIHPVITEAYENVVHCAGPWCNKTNDRVDSILNEGDILAAAS
jgi:hypothetical protein